MEKELISIKKNILKMVHKANVSHVGAALSVVDILYVLYFKVARLTNSIDRDLIILSKGHSSVALYATLLQKGLLPQEAINNYALDNGTLPCHIDKDKSPYFEVSTGSLGHGLGVGVGMALANKIDERRSKVFVICGDGEMNEGSVWEAIEFASTHHLTNLVLIVDFNNLQAFGATNSVIDQSNLTQRLAAFGFETLEINGHDLSQIQHALTYTTQDKPLAIVAHTVKGNGISFMENKLEWHYKSPNDEQLAAALAELEAK